MAAVTSLWSLLTVARIFRILPSWIPATWVTTLLLFLFETVSHYLAWAHFKLMMSHRMALDSRVPVLQACMTTPGLLLFVSPGATTAQPLQVFRFLRKLTARHQWLTPVILATQEAEIGRITV
jgi:hypothetical protein